MQQIKNVKALARAVIVVAAVVIFVSSVTFAALQSQQSKLAGNSIQTATADLRLSTDGSTYTDSVAGFNFHDLVPGGQPMPVTGYSFYLKNGGGTALSLKLAVPSMPTNPDGVDLSKVNVLLIPVGTGSGTQTFTLQSLLSSSASDGVALTSGNLGSGAVQQYKFQVSMSSDAVNGSSAMLGGIDFAFKGTAVSE